MKNISSITRRDIFDILTGGFIIIENEKKVEVKIKYYGSLDEIQFLSRMYNLEELPSRDSRFKNASGDIWQHTINNDDWDLNWVFRDQRFELSNGDDEVLLRFICEIFHPFVRFEDGHWSRLLEIFNELLRKDGYEIYEISQISGRSVYGWRQVYLRNGVTEIQSESIKANFDTEYVRIQIDLMNSLIDSAPHSAIGKAKELLEMCCKTILDEQNISYSKEIDLVQLMRIACESIQLSPKTIPDGMDGRESATRILGNLTNIAQGLAELRNLYGDGHGKSRSFVSLPPRYAMLAVGTAVTAVNFMWDTYCDRKKSD